MAIYHFSAQVISRSKGRSATAAAAYRSCSKIADGRTGETHDYSRKKGNAHSEVFLPDFAPQEYKDPGRLWNAVEEKERRKDAQLCREFNAALPRELDLEGQKRLVRDFAERSFVPYGMIAQADIHDTQDGNPHVHYMVTMREVGADGFGNKNRDWNSDDMIWRWRGEWAEEVNTAISKATNEFDTYVDAASLEAQGIDRAPQIHKGKYATKLERENKPSLRVELNEEIKRVNFELSELMERLRMMVGGLKKLLAEKTRMGKEKENAENPTHMREEQVGGAYPAHRKPDAQRDELQDGSHADRRSPPVGLVRSPERDPRAHLRAGAQSTADEWKARIAERKAEEETAKDGSKPVGLIRSKERDLRAEYATEGRKPKSHEQEWER